MAKRFSVGFSFRFHPMTQMVWASTATAAPLRIRPIEMNTTSPVPARRRARSEARTTARRRRLTPQWSLANDHNHTDANHHHEPRDGACPKVRRPKAPAAAEVAVEERRREDQQACRAQLQVAYDIELGLLHPQRLKVLGCEKESEVRSENDSEEEETYRTTGSSTSSRTQQR